MSDELIAQAEIGEAARKFAESDLGRCILGIALQEVEAAHQELENVDPTDWKKVAEIQLKARLGRSFERWLMELIDEGDNALSVFSQQQGD